jgi:hypothetical protein
MHLEAFFFVRDFCVSFETATYESLLMIDPLVRHQVVLANRVVANIEDDLPGLPGLHPTARIGCLPRLVRAGFPQVGPHVCRGL